MSLVLYCLFIGNIDWRSEFFYPIAVLIFRLRSVSGSFSPGPRCCASVDCFLKKLSVRVGYGMGVSFWISS